MPEPRKTSAEATVPRTFGTIGEVADCAAFTFVLLLPAFKRLLVVSTCVAILDNRRLCEAVGALRERGVRFPNWYPPLNLDPGSSHFRGVWSEIETLALLSQFVNPDLLEISERDHGKDTDIIIRLSPPYRLQVKGPLATHVDSDYAIAKMVRTARGDAARRFRIEQKTPWKGLFSTIRIHQGEQTEVYSGSTQSVNYPRTVHAAVVEIDGAVLARFATKNIERWIRKAVRQLIRYDDDAVLVPVLNASRYPLDQARAYKYIKGIFTRHPRWGGRVGGVLLLLRGYGEPDPITGLHATKIRFVGVENPLTPAERRLNPVLFNPVLQDEELYQENAVVISVDPPYEPWRIENRLLWVGGTIFGALPRQLGEPFMSAPP